MNTPKLRIKGFEKEWMNTSIGKVCPVNRGVRVTRKELKSRGKYSVYQNTNYPMGYFERYNVKAYNPFVIIGGSAGLIGFSKENFWAADDCAYFGDNENLDKVFLYNTLLRESMEIKKNVRWSSVPRLDRKVLLDLNISLPSYSEQQAIANFFKSLDSMIILTSKKIEKLKQTLTGCMQTMFPQKGENVPKVRFKGFEGDWKKNQIEDLFEIRNGYTPSKNVRDYWENGTIPWFRM